MGRNSILEQLRQQSIERMRQERVNRLHIERKDRPILLEAEKKKEAPATPQPAASSSSGGNNPAPAPVPPVPPTPEDVEIYTEIIDEFGDGGEIAMVKHIDHYFLNPNLDFPCLGHPLPLLNDNEPPSQPNCVVDLELDVDVTGSNTQLICGDGTTPGSCLEIQGTFILPASAPRPALLLFSMWVDVYPSEANFKFTVGGTCIAAKGEGAEELPCENYVLDPFPPPNIGGPPGPGVWYHMYATIDASNNIQNMYDQDGLEVYP